MLGKLIQSETQEQQKVEIEALVQQSRSNPSGLLSEVMAADAEVLSEKLRGHMRQGLDFLFNIMSCECCLAIMQDSQQLPQADVLSRLLARICSKVQLDKYNELAMVLDHHSTAEHALVVHRLYAQHFAGSTQEKHYPSMIPKFIRITSFIVEKYLSLKAEPANGQEDRVNIDKEVLAHCEEWVADSMRTFFNNLPAPKDWQIRQIVMVSLGDLIGALLESSREDMMNKDLLRGLQNFLLDYSLTHFSYQQFQDRFLSELRSCGFSNPIKKIQIPETYTLSHKKVHMNTQAVALITLKYLKSPHAALMSSSSLLETLVPVTSEILSRPYEVKIELIHMLKKLVEDQSPVVIRDGWEFKYPFFKFLFELSYHEEEHKAQIQQHIQFASAGVVVNGLLALKSIEEGSLNPQRDSFILNTLLEENIKEQTVVVVLRQIRFNESSQKSQDLLLAIASALGEKGRNLLAKWEGESSEPLRSKIHEALAAK